MKDHILLGKTIKKIELLEEGESLLITLDNDKTINATTYGECCSQTWIEDLINPEFALGTVTRAEDIDLPEQFHTPTKTEAYEEEMAYYGFVIETEKGTCTIAYRNSSNGYYGGSLDWPTREN